LKISETKPLTLEIDCAVIHDKKCIYMVNIFPFALTSARLNINADFKVHLFLNKDSATVVNRIPSQTKDLRIHHTHFSKVFRSHIMNFFSWLNCWRRKTIPHCNMNCFSNFIRACPDVSGIKNSRAGLHLQPLVASNSWMLLCLIKMFTLGYLSYD